MLAISDKKKKTVTKKASMMTSSAAVTVIEERLLIHFVISQDRTPAAKHADDLSVSHAVVSRPAPCRLIPSGKLPLGAA